MLSGWPLLAILVLPMFDTGGGRRAVKLTGRGLATADRGHLHHVLMRNGLTCRRRILVIVGILGLVAAGGRAETRCSATTSMPWWPVVVWWSPWSRASCSGNAESPTSSHKCVSAAVRAVWPGESSSRPWELAIRLQGIADWDLGVGRPHGGVAYRLNFQTAPFAMQMPAMHENYHGRWTPDPNGPPEMYLWRLEIPLFIDKLPSVGLRWRPSETTNRSPCTSGADQNRGTS